MRVDNQSNIKFQALPKAVYKLPNGESLRILELEKKDLGFIKNLTQNIDTFMNNREIETVTDKRLIIETAFNIIKEMLERIKCGQADNKTKMFIAECNSDICGVLVGGLPKKSPNNKILHSARLNATENETELNWLASWTQNASTKRKGVGKALLSEFIDTFVHDGVQSAFIQSEIPSLSFAQKFYEMLGFKAISKQVPHSQIEKNKDIVHCVEDLYDYEIVPMLGKIDDITKMKDKIFQSFNRRDVAEPSIDLFEKFKTT